VTTENAAQDTLLTADQAKAVWAEEMASRSGPAQDAAPEAEAATPEAEATPAVEPLSPLEQRIAALEATNSRLKNDLERTTGRVSSLQSAADAARSAAKAGGAPSTEQISAAVEDPAEWKQLMEDFPDWGVAFEKKMDAKIANAMRTQRPAAPDPAEVGSVVEQEFMRREISRVDRKHPTWRDTVKTPEFRAWKTHQAAEIQALEDSTSSDDAIEMLNLFEGSKASEKSSDIAQRRKDALEVAAVPGKPRQQAAAVKAAGDLTPTEAWALEKRKREQRRVTA